MHVKAKEKSAFTLDSTLAVYGIRQNPFPIGDTDDFFFSTSTLGKQLEALRNLVEYGDLILVVSGVEGAGKTTLLNQFLLAADPRWICCRIGARQSMNVDSMVDELLTGFGVKVRGDDSMADEALLRTHLAQVHASGDIALLVVDDAHLLPQICMEFLLGLAEQRDDMELRLLLASEPGRLGFSTNDPKRVHVAVLKPFDVQQCNDYLQTRLSYAGLVGDSPFAAQVVDEIYQDSGGVPGEIHPLAVHTLLANTDTSRLRRRRAVSTRVAVYAALALVVAGAGAFLLLSERGFERVALRDPATTGKVKGHTEAVTAPAESGGEEPVNTPAGKDRSASPEPDSAGRIAKQQPEIVQAETTRPAAAKTDDGVKVFTLDGDSVSTSAAVAVTSPAPAKGDLSAATGSPAVRLANNAPPAAGVPAASPKLHDLDWLRHQDPSHYVIQLVGTRDADAARKFLDTHKLGDQGAWFATSHENKPWYVVVYGMYPDNASARAAIKELPEALRAGSPWPRSVASVVESTRQ